MKKLSEYKIMPIFPTAPVGDPQISPDGTRILFTYSKVNMKEDKYETQIWIQGLEEKRPRQFTFGKQNATNPRWSPDGKWILFTSSRPSENDPKDEKKKKKDQLYVLPADGGEARQITQVEGGVQKPAWSPNGRNVLFLSPVFKGEKATEESDVKIIRRMKYKHDGRGFSVGEYTHLFVVPAKGGKVKQLTDGEYDVEAASWSPESKTIAFISNMDEDADKSFFKSIYTVPVKGGEPELLRKDLGRISDLEWSPDGKYIAYTGREIEDPGLVWHKNSELFVLPVGKGRPKCLTAGFDRTLGRGAQLKWTPDSKALYIKFPNYGTNHVYKVTMTGEVEAVTEGKMNVGSFSLDNACNKVAFTASDAVTPSELWIWDEGGQRKLTDLNKSLLRKLHISEPEEFWFTASDGVKVQGWIVKPYEFKEGEKYPTLIEIHGGPRGGYGFNLGAAEHEFQVLADHGYVVVYTNPRASTGYGEQFAGLISGHWGERDYDDIMEATDYVIENYDYVDAERFGVLGGSYGGFMTNWIVGHTDRYKAAVTQRCISNWYSFHGTSDIGWMTLPTHELVNGKDPWDDLELCMEKSPITYVKNMTTPLLIIHSENDHRCPMEQGEQLYIALKKLGRTTEFVRFPDEPHGLSRMGKPKHRQERLQHFVRWFDRYLK
jgi:dipeptidyl aminopeptidase/acylaminoacyl peptidase